jgi:hypothetical protein
MPHAVRAPGRSCHLDLDLNLNLNLTCFDLAPWLCFDVRCFPSLLAAAAAASTFTITTIVIFCKRSELRYFLRRHTAAWEKAEPWKRVEARRIGNTAVLCVSGLRQVWLESGEAMLMVQTQVRGCRRLPSGVSASGVWGYAAGRGTVVLPWCDWTLPCFDITVQ